MITSVKSKAFGPSLKARLGIGAALLGAGTLLTALILYIGMTRVSDRLDTALASEMRIARYASLSTQAATFLVISTEAIQAGHSAEVRIDRITPVADQLRRTFGQLRSGVEDAVAAARTLGVDEQSRFGTQSLGLARMEALLESTMTGLAAGGDRAVLRAHVDTFSSGFDPLLSEAVNTQVLFRNSILEGIDQLRRTLSIAALAIAALTVVVVLGFYLGLIRPQFRRLDRLRAAARRIGDEDFAVDLPEQGGDEIAQLYAETNRMAAALGARRDEVRAEWQRLSDIIAERTRELSNANARLEKIDENRRRFFADVSHELRTPLTVILMEAQIGGKGGASAEDAFRTIEQRAARLNRRIDDLLRVARSDSGELALDIAPHDLSAIAAQAADEVRAEADSAAMTLEVEAMDPAPVRCDANWVRQTLASLIRNAIRHARKGGMVRLAAIADEHTAGVAIIDNGPGVPPDGQADVFGRFAQGRDATAQGFGMGLSLAKWVIEAQEGQIDLTSPVPEPIGDNPGTMIVVRLPRDSR